MIIKKLLKKQKKIYKISTIKMILCKKIKNKKKNKQIQVNLVIFNNKRKTIKMNKLKKLMKIMTLLTEKKSKKQLFKIRILIKILNKMLVN